MALHAGSKEQFAGTLGAAIERALAGEIMAAKQKPLPDAGKADRRMLFGAIAQGVIDYLRAHESDLKIVLANVPAGSNLSATLQIQSPSLTATAVTTSAGRRVDVSGSRWPAGSVGFVWENTGQSGGTAAVSNGNISSQLTPPAGLSGVQRIGARNNAGDAVVVEVTL